MTTYEQRWVGRWTQDGSLASETVNTREVSLILTARRPLPQGVFVEARTRYERSLAIQQKALGSEHPSVATALNNLASLFGKQVIPTDRARLRYS